MSNLSESVRTGIWLTRGAGSLITAHDSIVPEDVKSTTKDVRLTSVTIAFKHPLDPNMISSPSRIIGATSYMLIYSSVMVEAISYPSERISTLSPAWNSNGLAVWLIRQERPLKSNIKAQVLYGLSLFASLYFFISWLRYFSVPWRILNLATAMPASSNLTMVLVSVTAGLKSQKFVTPACKRSWFCASRSRLLRRFALFYTCRSRRLSLLRTRAQLRLTHCWCLMLLLGSTPPYWL